MELKQPSQELLRAVFSDSVTMQCLSSKPPDDSSNAAVVDSYYTSDGNFLPGGASGPLAVDQINMPDASMGFNFAPVIDVNIASNRDTLNDNKCVEFSKSAAASSNFEDGFRDGEELHSDFVPDNDFVEAPPTQQISSGVNDDGASGSLTSAEKDTTEPEMSLSDAIADDWKQLTSILHSRAANHQESETVPLAPALSHAALSKSDRVSAELDPNSAEIDAVALENQRKEEVELDCGSADVGEVDVEGENESGSLSLSVEDCGPNKPGAVSPSDPTAAIHQSSNRKPRIANQSKPAAAKLVDSDDEGSTIGSKSRKKRGEKAGKSVNAESGNGGAAVAKSTATPLPDLNINSRPKRSTPHLSAVELLQGERETRPTKKRSDATPSRGSEPESQKSARIPSGYDESDSDEDWPAAAARSHKKKGGETTGGGKRKSFGRLISPRTSLPAPVDVYSADDFGTMDMGAVLNSTALDNAAVDQTNGSGGGMGKSAAGFAPSGISGGVFEFEDPNESAAGIGGVYSGGEAKKKKMSGKLDEVHDRKAAGQPGSVEAPPDARSLHQRVADLQSANADLKVKVKHLETSRGLGGGAPAKKFHIDPHTLKFSRIRDSPVGATGGGAAKREGGMGVGGSGGGGVGSSVRLSEKDLRQLDATVRTRDAKLRALNEELDARAAAVKVGEGRLAREGRALRDRERALEYRERVLARARPRCAAAGGGSAESGEGKPRGGDERLGFEGGFESETNIAKIDGKRSSKAAHSNTDDDNVADGNACKSVTGDSMHGEGSAMGDGGENSERGEGDGWVTQEATARLARKEREVEALRLRLIEDRARILSTEQRLHRWEASLRERERGMVRGDAPPRSVGEGPSAVVARQPNAAEDVVAQEKKGVAEGKVSSRQSGVKDEKKAAGKEGVGVEVGRKENGVGGGSKGEKKREGGRSNATAGNAKQQSSTASKKLKESSVNKPTRASLKSSPTAIVPAKNKSSSTAVGPAKKRPAASPAAGAKRPKTD